MRQTADGSTRALPLGDPDSWPLKAGDDVKIVAQLDPPAYAYVFWIDETGRAHPMYPWVPLDWDSRPQREQKVGELNIKDPKGNYFKITGNAAGMETLLLLARPEPLSVGTAEIREWFRGLPPLRFPGARARSWFENFDLVTNDLPRSPSLGGTATELDTPLGLQAELKRRIGRHAGYSRAVSFGRVGN